MNFYEATVKFKQLVKEEKELSRSLFASADEQNPKNFICEAFEQVNKAFGVRCDEKGAFSVFFWNAEKGKANIIFAVDMHLANVEDAISFIKVYMEEHYDIEDFSVSDIKEITTDRFHKLGGKGDDNGLIRAFRIEEERMEIDFRDNNQYHIQEEIISGDDVSLEMAIEESKKFMADESFVEELERIYSDENEKKYYGNPVHYKISASNMDSAVDITKLLVRALKANNRLEGSRVNKIYEIKEGCYDETDLRNVINNAQGNVVLFDLSGSSDWHGNYASAYEEVIEYMSKLIRINHVRTLCVFAENTNHPGFTDRFLSKLSEDIDIIEIKEGNGNREDAINYIESIAKQNRYELTRDEIEEIMPEKELFTVGETYEIYNKWFKNGLRNKIYKSYKHCVCMDIKKEDISSEPYDKLQRMIGLEEIKEVVDEIIDSGRIQKLRSEMGMDSYKTSLHMIFTGNPGSAKTTVARLIAQILAKEGILKTGKYIECGRADLVGRYVGWTAKAVRSKFHEAYGGVLFIDEAYSLVDDSNSFGDEAINTIVQEMEKYRDAVIVIFAGYPEKMKEFLNKNEGLRSRIAFHLDFPDYNADELLEILKLMAEQKGYKLDEEIEAKCHDIFEMAAVQKEFGNGRYVRNLFEQAMMAQSKRIIKEYKGRKVSRKALTTLKAEDFDVNASNMIQKEAKNAIGFAV